jgi:alkanesulfonate monooxygenase SsuD/methylene tetrahydromethanopterin reductase-like flavin-dependent oxidoreductase (luciferase family)
VSLPDYALRYERAAEFVDVVRGLWRSWDADAFLHDKTSGLYYDPDKRHVLDHKGKYFSVRGPLHLARSPQDEPVIFCAGDSEAGREIAAKCADVVFTAKQDLDDARYTQHSPSYRAELVAWRLGGSPDSLGGWQIAISSLVPSLSCRRCSPHAPFAKLEMLTAERPY